MSSTPSTSLCVCTSSGRHHYWPPAMRWMMDDESFVSDVEVGC